MYQNEMIDFSGYILILHCKAKLCQGQLGLRSKCITISRLSKHQVKLNYPIMPWILKEYHKNSKSLYQELVILTSHWIQLSPGHKLSLGTL